MSNIRLFFSENLSISFCAKLNKPQSHYLNKVMRVKKNENFSLFNHKGEWEAKINNISKGIVEFSVTKQLRQTENRKEIWLAFSPIKLNYLNFMIQKATELGIQKFVPVICEGSSVKDINIERLKKIIIESSEQSNRIALPKIIKKEALKNFLNNFPKDGLIIFCDINYEEKNLKDIFSKKIAGPICILVGPEGDFSESERQFIIDLKQSCSLSLSSNILKTETAAVAAVTIVNFQLNST